MKTDNQTSEFSSGMDELRCLLERQIELARQGKIDEVGVLSGQASSLVEKLAGQGLFELADPVLNTGQRERIAELYRDLCLILTNQKQNAGEQLNRLRKGKKAIGAYRNNTRS
ncbi:MAG: hypothetical protein DRP62_05660 [Planctomycetota bacterium]|nr:MAG: hypothetical protein DRP62_05660 [Planctomycetota bacterium]